MKSLNLLNKFKLLFFILFLLTVGVLSPLHDGQASPFTYSKKMQSIKIAPYEYRRYIYPQIRNIVYDFYQMIKTLHSSNINLNKIKENIATIRKSNNQRNISCQESKKENCMANTADLYRKIQNFDLLILQLQSKYIENFKITPKVKNVTQEDLVDNYLQIITRFDSLSSTSYKLLRTIENTSILHNLDPKLAIKYNQEVNVHINNLNLFFEFLIIDISPIPMQTHLEMVWLNFIRVLEKYVIYKKNKYAFKNNLESLNYSWNEFHHFMVKTSHITPGKTVGHISSIHQRWNSILKIILN